MELVITEKEAQEDSPELAVQKEQEELAVQEEQDELAVQEENSLELAVQEENSLELAVQEEAMNTLNTVLETTPTFTPTFDDFCEPCEKKPTSSQPTSLQPTSSQVVSRLKGSSKAVLKKNVEVSIGRGDMVSMRLRQKNRAVIQPKHEFLGRMMSGRPHRLVGGMPMRMRIGT